jgi:hypothetical protein
VVRFVFVGYYLLLLHRRVSASADGTWRPLHRGDVNSVWYLGQSARNGWFLLPVFLVRRWSNDRPFVRRLRDGALGVCASGGGSSPSRQDTEGAGPTLLPMLVPCSSWSPLGQAQLGQPPSAVGTCDGLSLIPPAVSDAFGSAGSFQQGVRQVQASLLMRPAVPVEAGDADEFLIDALTA